MPVIDITLLPGYDAEVESRLVRRVAQATRSVIAAVPAGTTVFVRHPSTYQRDGRVFHGGPGPARPEAAALVRHFLERMQERDLPAAQALLAPGFVMQFPGAAPMSRLEQLVEWGKGRYQRVGKVYERFDESWGDEATVVYCSGTLYGVWLDGSAFEGIRFIDRFEVVDGLITRQDVWNDLAEIRPRG
jgi:phenylpyruvate tautomerase PptA (4-oxalocrotonate tautomerase family)/ketosteroid isomerase-like protein